MKRTIAKIAVLLGIVSGLCNCGQMHQPTLMRSYINYYLDFPDGWEIYFTDSTQMLYFLIQKDEGYTAGKILSDYTPVVGKHLGDDWDISPLSQKHYELSIINNDTSYNHLSDVWTYDGPPQYDFIWVYYRYFTSVNITSSANYDSNHPAGASLNDIVDIVFRSPKSFIDSGYDQTIDWKQNPLQYGLDELKPDDTKLLWANSVRSDVYHYNADKYYDFAFYFNQLPTAESKHKLSIEVTTNDNKSYTYTTSVDFGVQSEE